MYNTVRILKCSNGASTGFADRLDLSGERKGGVSDSGILTSAADRKVASSQTVELCRGCWLGVGTRASAFEPLQYPSRKFNKKILYECGVQGICCLDTGILE